MEWVVKLIFALILLQFFISLGQQFPGAVTIGGDPHVTDALLIDEHRVVLRRHVLSFFQANRFLLAPFINEVLLQAGSTPKNVLELYSGVGFFSIPLSQTATELIGIETKDRRNFDLLKAKFEAEGVQYHDITDNETLAGFII